MTKQELTRYRKLLSRLRDQASEKPVAKIEPNRTDEVSVGVADEDAQALSEMMQSLASSRNRNSAEVLGQIARALRKLDTAPDDFGMCEACEEGIAKKRLDLMPYAALCAQCQSKRDPRRGQTRKSITDYR